jgi:hypothetical protein
LLFCRQHAEDDYSNFLHLQSILPPAYSRVQRHAAPLPSPADSIVEERGSFLSLADAAAADPAAVETAIAAGDDVFLLEVRSFLFNNILIFVTSLSRTGTD